MSKSGSVGGHRSVYQRRSVALFTGAAFPHTAGTRRSATSGEALRPDRHGLRALGSNRRRADGARTGYHPICRPISPPASHTPHRPGLTAIRPELTSMAASDTFPTPEFVSNGDRARDDRRLFGRFIDQRDPLDREAIIERFMPLARQIAARYQRPEEPFDDVFQVACYGLVKAVDRFDVERGVAFSSYAVPTITGEIKRHFRDRAWAVRVPRDLQELALRVERVGAELTRDLGRAPSVDEVARALGGTAEDVLEAMEAATAYHATSLDTPRPSGDEEAGASLGDTVGHTDDGFDRAEQRALLSDLMRSLTQREREVIRLRFEADLTQAQIGEIIGVSQMQVSRVLRQAIARLRVLARQGAPEDPCATG